MFQQLAPLLRQRSVLLTVTALQEDQIRVNVIPKKLADGENAALTTPMDVIKTMLQTRGHAADQELRTVNGFAAGCRLLYRREGMRGFFKGVRPRVVTTMPSTAICWSAYEASKCVFPFRHV